MAVVRGGKQADVGKAPLREHFRGTHNILSHLWHLRHLLVHLLNIISYLCPESWQRELFSAQCQAEAKGLVIREHGNKANTYFCL